MGACYLERVRSTDLWRCYPHNLGKPSKKNNLLARRNKRWEESNGTQLGDKNGERILLCSSS